MLSTTAMAALATAMLSTTIKASLAMAMASTTNMALNTTSFIPSFNTTSSAPSFNTTTSIPSLNTTTSIPSLNTPTSMPSLNVSSATISLTPIPASTPRSPASSTSGSPVATTPRTPAASTPRSPTASTSTLPPVDCSSPGTVCVQSGSNCSSRSPPSCGNVFVGGSPVCDDSWGMEDAHVACRQLGFARAKGFTKESLYGRVSANFAMDNVKCLGNESRLVDCPHAKQDDCSSGEGAGVICDIRDLGDIVNSTCYDLDIAYNYGDTLGFKDNMESVAECQDHCQITPNCTYFTYYPSNKRCNYKNGRMRSVKDGAISGPRNCSDVEPEEECFDEGVGYNYGDYLDYFPANTVLDCQKRCQEYSGCTHFSFYTNNNECYMKTGSGNTRYNSEVVSGPKYCGNNQNVTTDLCKAEGTVCLKGGAQLNGKAFEGNVFVGGKPVCDDSWDVKDGTVVCRSLGFHGIVQVTKEGRYGRVPSDFAMDNVACNGTELKLTDCSYKSRDDCGAREAAGVICDTRTKQQIDKERQLAVQCFQEGVGYDFGKYLDYDVVHSAFACQQHCSHHPDCSHFTFYTANFKCFRKTSGRKKSVVGAISGPRNCSYPNDTQVYSTTQGTCTSYGFVCLEGGRGNFEGNVMVGGKPVCDDEWTLIDGDVACKEIGFRGALSVTTKSRFGRTSPDFSMDNVQCDGTEERLIDCAHAKSDDCSAAEAAGVVCDTTNSSIINRDQINNCFEPGVSYSSGEWLDSDVTMSAHDCQTHCRSHPECRHFTFYTNTNTCYRKTGNNPVNRQEAISGPRECGATTTTLRPCDAPGVVCLEGGRNVSEGHVMVGGKPVCDDEWSNRDGRVVCRELGFVDVIRVTRNSEFGPVGTDFAMDNVDCTGREPRLALCRHTSRDDCTGGEAAGVVCDTRPTGNLSLECSQPDTVCLVGGAGDHEGNVHIGGLAVCQAGWDFVDAVVVCKELGFQDASLATKQSHFGPVTQFGITQVGCTQTQTKISQCRHSTDRLDCGREEAAGVVCIKGVSSRGGSNVGWVVVVVVVVAMVGAGLWYRDQLQHGATRIQLQHGATRILTRLRRRAHWGATNNSLSANILKFDHLSDGDF